ncbi:hypothetical protein Thal_1603 [Thermocrinis albus DSM 14484]|uniref:Uncharacterized protein n=1 Tax=Thermocrinis albus (strain DSM 14484 / JCM 11386 / HI 11/12) TaxID=638303 RepID=D3SNA1_THEAH|nr:hypothetical protein [Thermocrinis albus]ADC90231.1 hypothetical protein Thal_1603 [Thermocrinis albus DSM 14484]
MKRYVGYLVFGLIVMGIVLSGCGGGGGSGYYGGGGGGGSGGGGGGGGGVVTAPSGSLDTTFGTNGKVRTDIGGREDGARALAIQSDGKIVVAGFSSGDFAVVRYCY